MKRRSLGQRQTRQRETIAQVIEGAGGPLTVPEIHERAQEALPKLGVATVYRTLNLLQEAKLIQTVILPSGETRYESSDLGHHHHFHCRACDSVYDLDDCLVAMPESGTVAGGFVVEDHEVTLYGRCPECVE